MDVPEKDTVFVLSDDVLLNYISDSDSVSPVFFINTAMLFSVFQSVSTTLWFLRALSCISIATEEELFCASLCVTPSSIEESKRRSSLGCTTALSSPTSTSKTRKHVPYQPSVGSAHAPRERKSTPCTPASSPRPQTGTCDTCNLR